MQLTLPRPKVPFASLFGAPRRLSQELAVFLMEATSRETLYIHYPGRRTDNLKVPVEILAAKLDIRCRRVQDTRAPMLLGAMAGGGLGSYLFMVGALVFLPVTPLALALVIGVMFFMPFGGVIGAGIGAWLGPKTRFAPHPFWVGSRTKKGVDPYLPILVQQAAKAAADTKLKPEVRTAEAMYEVAEARDIRDKFTGRKALNVVAVGTAALLLFGMMFMLIIFYNLWQG